MTPELTALVLAGLLQVIHFVVVSVRANFEVGSAYLAGPRDRAPDRELSTATARLKRALDNHAEWLPLFAIAVLAVVLADKGGAFTAACAWVYLAARILYIPAYALGLAPWRSAIWGVGFLATLALLLAALF